VEKGREKNGGEKKKRIMKGRERYESAFPGGGGRANCRIELSGGNKKIDDGRPIRSIYG